jgi:hypothetical protein
MQSTSGSRRGAGNEMILSFSPSVGRPTAPQHYKMDTELRELVLGDTSQLHLINLAIGDILLLWPFSGKRDRA